MANENQISAGLIPIDTGESATSNNCYISAGIIPADGAEPDYSPAVSDTLEVVQDAIVATLGRAGSLSDSLEVIEDAILAGKIIISGPGMAARWIAPLKITPKSDDVDTLYLAAHPVRHPSYYFQPKIKNYGLFTRSISAPVEFIRTGDVSIRILDPDNTIRQAIAPKTIQRATAELRLGPEGGSYKAFLRPWKREVADVTQPRDGELQMTLKDAAFSMLEREVPRLIDTDNFPNLPENPTAEFANHAIGIISSEDGALHCPLVDTAMHYYLVNRHKVQSVDAVYRKTSDSDEFELVDPSEYSVKTDYYIESEDGFGDYCTLLDFTADQEGAEIRANVHGYVDGDGNLDLTNFADALLSIFEYLATVYDRTDAINVSSFETVATKVSALTCAGAFTKPITFAEAVTQIQRSCNIDVFADKNDRISVSYTATNDAATVNLSDLLRLYKGSVKQQIARPTYNQLPYRYSPNYAAGTWQTDKYNNDTDQAALGDITPDEVLNMYWVRDATTAGLVAAHRARYLDLDSFRIEGEIPLIPVLEDLELGDLVTIDHFGGIRSGGFTSEEFKILELATSVDGLSLRFKGIRRGSGSEQEEEEEEEINRSGGDYYISAGGIPIDLGEAPTEQSGHISAGLVPDDL